jgi:hypothetical protein
MGIPFFSSYYGWISDDWHPPVSAASAYSSNHLTLLDKLYHPMTFKAGQSMPI